MHGENSFEDGLKEKTAPKTSKRGSPGCCKRRTRAARVPDRLGNIGALIATAHEVTANGGPMPDAAKESTAAHANPASVSGLYGVRYQVKDVARSIDFYTQRLGFKLDRKHLPAFAQVSVGDFRLTLSGPGASG